jgi:phosphoenolpyruvate synthase/pyruvate phosphate dikinase
MDIEWAKDGITGRLYIVQARPETVRSRQEIGALTQTFVTDKGPSVLEGTAIGSDAAVGKVRVILDVKDISQMQPGEILVADITDPDWVSLEVSALNPTFFSSRATAFSIRPPYFSCAFRSLPFAWLLPL